MSFSHANHPLWQTSLDLAFDCSLELGAQPSGNPILERLRKTVKAYVTTLEIALRKDHAALGTARNLLVQMRNNLVLARDLGLVERRFVRCLKEHLMNLVPHYRRLCP